MDRISLNGFIERLIDSSGSDQEAREAIVEFANSMKGSSHLQFRGLIQKPGGTFTGQTPEHGSVQVDDDKPETKEFSRGTVQERVGYYKVWKQKDWVHISHFWKSDVETASDAEMSQQWVLALDRTGNPQWFGERGLKHIYTFKLGSVIILDVGREMFEERWGVSVGKQHKGAFAIALTIAT
jgi:hypothetical protein